MSSYEVYEQIVLKDLGAHSIAAKYNGCRGVVVETADKYLMRNMRTVLVLSDESEKAVRMTVKTKYLKPYCGEEDEPASVIFGDGQPPVFGCSLDVHSVEAGKGKIKEWKEAYNAEALNKAKTSLTTVYEDALRQSMLLKKYEGYAGQDKFKLQSYKGDGYALFELDHPEYNGVKAATWEEENERLRKLKKDAWLQKHHADQEHFNARQLIKSIDIALANLGPEKSLAQSIKDKLRL